MDPKELKQNILKGISTEREFNDLAMALFRLQSTRNNVYKNYIHDLGLVPDAINTVADIPFLPIEAFKHHELKAVANQEVQHIFESSGTGKGLRSKHLVFDLDFYLDNARIIFEAHYGSLTDYCVLAFLPSYHEQKASSLLYMVKDFIGHSDQVGSGFYIGRKQALIDRLKSNKKMGVKTLLIGVSYALLDLAEDYPMDLSETIVMETGGMKGRRKELNRMELHACLKDNFSLEQIHSEYGMTELMSQAYSQGDGIFLSPATMRLKHKEITDPFTTVKQGRLGTVNIIDLANVDSCAFIATQDLGRDLGDHKFSIEGRLDHADIRGCSLMYRVD